MNNAKAQSLTIICLLVLSSFTILYTVEPASADLNYSVTFTETGLAVGTDWNVTLNGVTYLSNTNSVVCSVVSGEYAYSVASPTGYFAVNASGSVVVSGANVEVSVMFLSRTYGEWTYGGSYVDCLYGVVKCSDGGYALVGATQSFGAGGSDGWLVLTDSSGNYQSVEYGLSVVVVGNGLVSPGNGTYTEGSSVDLIATPAAGWLFAGWGGDASGTENTIVTMDGNKTVTATFIQETTPIFIPDTCCLTVITVGSGTVKPGNSSYLLGASVDLKAIAASGWLFAGWGGDASGAVNTTITMNGTKTVYATFTPDTYTLTMLTVGEGSVLPGNASYLSGTTVDLKAICDAGWNFAGWSGNAVGLANTAITMNGNMTIIATFTENSYTLTVITIGQGTVSPYNQTYSYNEQVNLNALPNANWTFSGWSGDITSTTNDITVAVTDDITLTATFTAQNSDTPTVPSENNSTTLIATETVSNATYNVGLSGNITVSQMSNMTITPYQSNVTTVVEFTVTGQSGTHGFGNLTLSKDAIPYGTTPVVYIDGVPAENQGYTEDEDNYYIWYTTSFSTHEITIAFSTSNLETPEPTIQPADYTVYYVLAGLTVAVVFLLLFIVVAKRRQKKWPSP